MIFVEREFRNHQHVYNMSMQSDKDINKFILYLMKWRSIMRDHPSYGNSRRIDDLFSEVGEELTAMKKLLSELRRKARESVVKRGYKTTEVAPGNYSTDQ